MALEIIQKTNDGNDLAPEQLSLVEAAVNGWLTESGEVAFHQLYESVEKGYVKPWYHNIENLTQDQEGFIYWKGEHVEHYSFQDYEKADEEAHELSRRCKILESRGIKPTAITAIWKWEEL